MLSCPRTRVAGPKPLPDCGRTITRLFNESTTNSSLVAARNAAEVGFQSVPALAGGVTEGVPDGNWLGPEAVKLVWPVTLTAWGEKCVPSVGHCSKGGKMDMRLAPASTTPTLLSERKKTEAAFDRKVCPMNWRAWSGWPWYWARSAWV